MQATHRTLIALALTAALASPAAFAQGKPTPAAKPTSHATTAPTPTRSSGAATADSVKTGARPASPTLPTQSADRASDAITARTAAQESRGNDAKDANETMTSGKTTATMGSGATGTIEATSSATTNPGKGNWWTAADADGDGKLSATEAAANAGVNARFATIDADKDGFVTQDEYRTFFTQTASQGEQHAAAHSMVVTRDVWLKLDADADSKISLAEAAGNVELSGAFTAMDANKDGFVTQDEYRAYTKANMQ